MVKKRVIPCLDVADGRVVKGVNFETCGRWASRSSFARRYSELGADELVFLDITATLEGRGPILDIIGRAAEELTIPFTAGGGITGSGRPRPVAGRRRQGRDQPRGVFDDPEILTALAGEFGACRPSSARSTPAAERSSPTPGESRVGATRSTGREAVERGAEIRSRRSIPTGRGRATTWS